MQTIIILLTIIATVFIGTASILMSSNKYLGVWVLFVALVMYSLTFCLYIREDFIKADTIKQTSETAKQKEETPVKSPTPEINNPNNKQPTSLDEKGRLFVNVEPAHLIGFYEELTRTQANKLMEDYAGKWIKFTGKIQEIRNNHNLTSTVVILSDPTVKNKLIENTVSSIFTEPANIYRVQGATRNEVVTIVGKISNADRETLVLTNCEIID